MFLSTKFSVIIRDLLIFTFLEKNYPSSNYSISLIAFNNTYTDFIFHQCKAFNYKISLCDFKMIENHGVQKPLNEKLNLLKVKNIIKNTFRFFFVKQGNNTKNKLYAISHRNTSSIIKHLSKNSNSKVFVEGSFEHGNFNVVGPNLFLIFFQLLAKISNYLNKNKIADEGDAIIKTFNKLIGEKVKTQLSYHEFYFYELFSLINDRLIQFKTRTKYYKYIIEKVNPDSILHTSYVSMEQRVLFKLCKKHNIKTYAVEHGLMNEIRLSSDIIYSDYLLVWGKESYDSYNYLHPKKNKNKVLISGCPDIFPYNQKFNNKKEKNKTGIVLVNLPHINIKNNLSLKIDSSFAPTASLAKGFYIFRAYQKIFSILKNEAFHIQVHPLDDIQLIKSLLSKYSNLTFSQGDSSENISKCKLLISTSSTLVLDAIKNKKPSILFWPISKELLTTSLRYNETGYVFKCFNIQQLISTFYKIELGSIKVDDNKRSKYLANLIDCAGKESLKRCEEVIFGT